jgi:hypothetical protein
MHRKIQRKMTHRRIPIMRKLVPGLMVAMALVFSGVPARAQEYNRAEVFLGGSLYDANTNVYGWQASAAVNVSSHVGVVADFGGHYDQGSNSHEFLFGPRFRTGRARAVGFGHALFGGQRLGSASLSINSLTMGFGGGLDVFVNDSFGFRAMQFDWLPTRLAGTWFKENYRYGFGVVIPFGN